MNLEPLTHENFPLFAARHYNNPHCVSWDEHEGDLLHLKYIKKLVTRYIDSGELKERLILNHLIILSNVFAPEILCKIIWLKMEGEYLSVIKPFLIFLNLLPDRLYNINGQIMDTTLIPMDARIITILRKI